MNAQYRIDYGGDTDRKIHDLIIEPTAGTPYVKFSRDEGMFMVKGNSLRPEIHEFYEPLISRIKIHLDEGHELNIVLFFNMINPTTAKVLFDLFKFVRLKLRSGMAVQVTWCTEAENDEMLETGKDFAEIYDLNFKFLTT